MPTVVTAVELRRWLGDGDEIALLDVSDGGPYARAHILVASNVSLSQFEAQIPRLVPRHSTRLVLTDEDGSTLGAASALLESHGYINVAVLADGNRGWTSAGFRLFAGSNIVSKAFGEMVESRCGTPHVEAETLKTWMEESRPMVMVDVRPQAEYRTISIPGATNCPGMEAFVRVPSLVGDESVPIVVNCAGRTRSIIGAQTLRESGVRNPVFALKNGTMGWQLGGFTVEQGRTHMVAEPAAIDVEASRRSMRRFAADNGISFVDRATVDGWLTDDERTTYLFDVRLSDSYNRSRFPGSVNAPGGQLIQNTDTFAPVRNSRIVLIDEHECQAVMTAHWLARMGWEAHVLSDPARHLSEHGVAPVRFLGQPDPTVVPVDGDELRRMMAASECAVIDVGESYWYREGRILGSHYAMRSRLTRALDGFDRAQMMVFVCGTGTHSMFAAGDARRLGFSRVGYLKGGRSEWRRVGGDLESIGPIDDELVLTATDDMWYPPWARAEGAEEAMAEYLSWEVGLVESIGAEEYLRFGEGFNPDRQG